MDILEKNRLLIDAIDCKVEQLMGLKSSLINEYNEEAMKRESAARAAKEAEDKKKTETK